MSDDKKKSFEEIQNKFFNAAKTTTDTQSDAQSTTEPTEPMETLKLDASHFDFDSGNPEAILIAGSSTCDASSKSVPSPEPACAFA